MAQENPAGNLRSHDWTHLLLGVVLSVSPLLKNFNGGPGATRTAMISGVVIACLAIVSVLRSAEWAVWGVAAAGICAIAAAFALGLAPASLAFKTFLLAGALTVASALWKLWRIRHPESA